MKIRFLFIFLGLFLFPLALAENTDSQNLKKTCLMQSQQKSWDKAIETCRKAAEAGSSAAAALLGRIYEKGLYQKPDLPQAQYWYEIAAEGGSKEAAYRLAELWLTPNTGLGYEPQKAAYYLEKAYHNGHVKAGLALAAMLRTGRDITTNYPAAFRIYQDLSSTSREANYQSGKMLMSGQGGKKDEKQAFKHYHIAAKAGHIAAQRDLGLAYFEGMGVEKSLFDAYKWLDIATFQGDMEAASALHILEETIAEEQAMAARKAARNWLCENNKEISGCP